VTSFTPPAAKRTDFGAVRSSIAAELGRLTVLMDSGIFIVNRFGSAWADCDLY
jgi:hypothetical protein